MSIKTRQVHAIFCDVCHSLRSNHDTYDEAAAAARRAYECRACGRFYDFCCHGAWLDDGFMICKPCQDAAVRQYAGQKNEAESRA